MAPFILQKWCNEGQFSFEWDRSHLTTALSGVMPLFRGRRRQKKNIRTYTQIHLADRVVLCWLGSPHCDLNLFCLEYECPLGSWCTSREQTDRMCEHYVHVGLSICGRKTEREWDRERRAKTETNKKGTKKERMYGCACVFVSVWFSGEPRPCSQVLSREDRKERGWKHWTQGLQ